MGENSTINALLNRCLADRTARSWEEFIAAARSPVAIQIVRTLRQWSHPTADLVEDLTQDVFLKICENNYAVLHRLISEPDLGILAYLRAMAASIAVDQLRMRRAQRRGGAVRHESLESAVTTTSLANEQATVDRRLFLEQVDRCLGAHGGTRPRDRTIFWLYFRQGLTSRAISEVKHLELSQKGVESLLLRLIRAVRVCLERRGVGPMGPSVSREGKIV